MATSKSFFGKRRGSTKNFTFAVFNGKQVTKEKAEQVKNPRTLAQMKNRMILTTSSAAYAAMKEIVDHSFQGYVYGLQNMSRFQSVNNKLLRANLEAATSQFAYANYGDARVLPGAYVISEGSLAPIPSAMFACAISAADSVAFTLQPGVTAAELTANAIISALGLQVGELATLCFLADCGTEAGYKFGFIRLTVKAAGDVQLTAQNLTEYFTIESNAPVAITSVTDGTAVITATIDGVQAAGGLCYGCIHSANENGVWKRSDCRMTIADGTALEPTATQAIATYPVGGSKILNNGDIPGGHTPASLPNFHPNNGNNAVIGVFSGLNNPLYYLTVTTEQKRCEFELLVDGENKPWALVDGETPSVVQDAPSTAQLFQDIKTAIESGFIDADEWLLINSGTSTSENAPTNFVRLVV